jgi:hypothetical protein
MTPTDRAPFTLLTFAPPLPSVPPQRATECDSKLAAASLRLARKLDRLRQINPRIYAVCQTLIEAYVD